ncbi:MAG: DUF2279 domain-containing protein [bacterium]
MKRLKGQVLFLTFALSCSLFLPFLSYGQNIDSLKKDSATIHKGRLTGVLTAQGALYIASLAGLYYAWYKDYPQSSFHFFNDNKEWMQMDKFGHATSSYYFSRICYESYKWSGFSNSTSAWLGGAISFAYMLNIELLDAFSAGWGFSPGDLTANTIGCAIFVVQQLTWKEQRFFIKYSYHPTQYPQYRPDLLGNNLIQKMVKDYNGMSFWLSGNISSFLPKKSKFPKWLNIAFGYGAEGMTGASENSTEFHGKSIPPFVRYRKFLLSIDVDLTRIPTRSKFLKGLFTIISFLKIPAPAIEYNTLGQFKFHPFYF